MSEAAAWAGEVAELTLDRGTLREELVAESSPRVFKNVLRAETSRRLWTMAMSGLPAVTPRHDKLHVAACVADLVQRVRIVIGVRQQVALNRRDTQHASRHHSLIDIHRRETPRRKAALGAGNHVQFVTFGFAAGGSTLTGLAIF